MVKIHIEDYKKLVEYKVLDLIDLIARVNNLSEEEKGEIVREECPSEYIRSLVGTPAEEYFIYTRTKKKHENNKTLLLKYKAIEPLIPKLIEILINGIFELEVKDLLELQINETSWGWATINYRQ